MVTEDIIKLCEGIEIGLGARKDILWAFQLRTRRFVMSSLRRRSESCDVSESISQSFLDSSFHWKDEGYFLWIDSDLQLVHSVIIETTVAKRHWRVSAKDVSLPVKALSLALEVVDHHVAP